LLRPLLLLLLQCVVPPLDVLSTSRGRLLLLMQRMLLLLIQLLLLLLLKQLLLLLKELLLLLLLRKLPLKLYELELPCHQLLLLLSVSNKMIVDYLGACRRGSA